MPIKKILIIDDNKKDLISFNAIINDKEPKYKLLTAENGDDGFELALNEEPDIIIIDVKLPDLDGFQVCKKIKNNSVTENTPIIMISSWGTNTDNRLKSLRAGAESFMSKPVDIDELLAQIKVFLRIKEAEDNLKKERDKFEKIALQKTNKLKELNNYLNLQIRRMPIGLITWDIDFKIKSWNPAATQIFGYSAKESSGKTPFDLILTPDLKVQMSELMKKLTAGDKSAHSVNNNITKDGRVIVCEWTNTPLKDDDENVIGVLSMVKDITTEHYQNKLGNSITALNKRLLTELGKDFLKQFVLQLANTLDADITFIGLLNKNKKSVSTISVCMNGEISKNFNYKLSDTPCKKVITSSIYSIPSSVQNIYPQDKLLQDNNIEGYVGLPLYDTQGEIIGLVVALFKKHIQEVHFCESIIQIFIPRAVAEIERIRFEKAIRDSEKQFKIMIEKFPYPLALTKGNRNTYVNGKFTSLFGYTLRDMPTINDWFNLAYPNKQYQELVRTSWNQAAEIAIANKTEIKTQEWNLITKDGTPKTCEFNMVPFDDRSLIVMKDVTTRKRAELIQTILYQISNATNTSKNLTQFLKIIRQYLGNVLDTTNFLVAFIDEKRNLLYSPYEADEKDKITSWSAEKSLTGYAIKSKKPLLIKKDEILKLQQEGKIKLIGTTAESWIGVPLIVDDYVLGALVIQSYTNPNAYNDNDVKLLEFISFQISISIQQLQHEIELEDALNKAIESDRLKSVFLSTMSHELRTPLNAIIGFSELINSASTPEEIEKFSKTIFNSGNLLLELVEGLFDITLIEAGEIKIEKKYHNLKSLIDDVLDVIKAERINTAKEMLSINIGDYPFNSDFEIFTDINKLKQILLNLLKNALKFTHHGSITFEIEKVKVEQKSFIKFIVKDTGIGIPKNKFKLIFDIFRQADDTHTRKYGGAGIGLSVTQKLTTLLGGKVDVESELKKGTTFSVFIPIVQDKQQLTKNPENENSLEVVYPHKTILVAEDDDSSLSLLEFHMKKLGVKVVHARNGQEVVEYISKSGKTVDLILMDINMPIMNGYKATRLIKEFNPSIPIIAQTAYAISGDRERAIESGCIDYIAKPINGNQLINLIKKYL